MENRDKSYSFARLKKSLKHAIDGVVYAFQFEQNIAIHVLILFIVVLFGIIFEISHYEWLILVVLGGFVTTTELINTSIEAAVDLVSPKYHKFAKIAKDTAAAAVLILAITSIICGIIIFYPKLCLLF